MGITRTVVVSAFAGVVLLLAAQVRVVRANSSFAGRWEGKINDLPGIDLDIEEHDGKISGHIVFYYQERSDPNGPWHTAAEYPALLLVPHVQGKVLTFEVEHHKCHTCVELGPNAKFRMELTGPNEARLWKFDAGDGSSDAGPTLVRQSSSSAVSVVPNSSPDKQPAPTVPASPTFAGTWNGKRDDGAGLDLDIHEENGKD